jgi:hypothetical protein
MSFSLAEGGIFYVLLNPVLFPFSATGRAAASTVV